jgi:hypothetical protein
MAGLSKDWAPEGGTQGDNIVGEAPNNISKCGGHVNSPQPGEESGLLDADTEAVAEANVPVKQEGKGAVTVKGCRGAGTGNEASGGS